MLGYLWLIGGILLAFVLLFFVADHYLLKDKKKDAKKPAKDPAPTPAAPKAVKPETKPEPKPQKTAVIYNSALADELDATLKQKPAAEDAPHTEHHASRRGGIAQYIAQKKYQAFNFEPTEIEAVPADEPLTVTKEDYKKIVALSNITDKK